MYRLSIRRWIRMSEIPIFQKKKGGGGSNLFFDMSVLYRKQISTIHFEPVFVFIFCINFCINIVVERVPCFI